MPSYPPPAVGVSPTGIDKADGWNQPPPAAHTPDAGINHTAGLSKAGLDATKNPAVTGVNVTPLAATTATIVWTTPSMPAGQVQFRKRGLTTYQLYNETAGDKTAHSAPLTGLTTATDYEYRINQPGVAGSGGMTYYWGTFRTT